MESARQDISLNTSVDQILKRHVQWDMFERQAGIMPLAKPVVAQLLAYISKDDITNLAKNVAKSTVQDITTTYVTDERKDRFGFIFILV